MLFTTRVCLLAVGLAARGASGLVVQSRMASKRTRDVAMSASDRVYVSGPSVEKFAVKAALSFLLSLLCPLI